MLNRSALCHITAFFKAVLQTASFTTLLQLSTLGWATGSQSEVYVAKVSSVHEVIQNRPILTNWVDKYHPTGFEAWSQDKQVAYIDNQEQARALIHKIKHQQCSNIPCLAALDCAEQLYQKSKAQKRFQERDLDYLHTNAQGVALTSIALSVIVTSVGFATGNLALIAAAIAVNASHFATNQILTQSALSVMNNDLQKTEAVLTIEKEALGPLASKLEVASKWAARARKAILHNMCLEHSGNIIRYPSEELNELFAPGTIQNLEAPVLARRGGSHESLLEKLTELPEGKVFALSLMNPAQVTFKSAFYKGQFYIVIPHPEKNIVFGFIHPSQLLTFFSDMAGYYKSEHISLMTPAS